MAIVTDTAANKNDKNYGFLEAFEVLFLRLRNEKRGFYENLESQ